MELGRSWQGQTVDGRFRLEQYLGGSERHATFLTTRQSVKAIIKLVLASSTDAEAQLALWRRAAQLAHAHLLQVLESGRCWLSGKELLYVVVEYADENLGEVLPHRALTHAEAGAMLRPMLEALSYLHSLGLVHAHLRPSNILAAGDRLKLSTDGVQLDGKSVAHWLRSIYDAPELAHGQISPAADIWSLGVTLVEALTQKSSRKANTDYAGLPVPFDDVVSHCLQDDPAARWTIAQIAAKVQARPAAEAPVADRRSGKPVSQRRSLPLIVMVAALAVIIVGAGLMFLRRGSSRPHVWPEPPQPSAASPTRGGSAAVANTPGEVLRRVMPAASASALHTIHGHIKVRVRAAVDASGGVTSTRFINTGSSKYFARVAMQAAQQWKFTAPTAGGQPVPSQWTLLFEFSRGGMQASAEPSSPRE